MDIMEYESIIKRNGTGGLARAAEHLPHKCETLSSKSITAKNELIT
jgi:hypothetical protein